MTGSGKTAAFALPFLERLLHRPRGLAATYVLVLTPTRELAVQVGAAYGGRLGMWERDVCKELCMHMGVRREAGLGGWGRRTRRGGVPVTGMRAALVGTAGNQGGWCS